MKQRLLLLFAVIAVSCAAVCLSACFGGTSAYDGTYYSTTGSDDIVISGNKLNWSGKTYKFSDDNGVLATDGTWVSGAPLNFAVYENNCILSLGIVLSFDSGLMSTRNGNFSQMFINYNSSYSIAEAYTFDPDGTYSYMNTENVGLGHSGTYTLKDGLLLMQGNTGFGKQMRYSWYVTDGYQLHYGVYVRNLENFIPSDAGNPDVPEEPDEPDEPQTVYYALRYSAGEGGTIQGTATQRIEEGDDGAAVTAVPKNGYEFVGWSDGVISAQRMDKNVNSDINVRAEFEPVSEFTLTYTAEEGGHIEGETSQTVTRGGNGTTVTAVADEGYEFLRWSDGISVPWRTEISVYSDLSVTAEFKKLPTCTLTYTASEGGHIEGETIQSVIIGNNGAAVIAVADEGYEFVGWSDGVLSAERTERSVYSDMMVTALFEKLPSYILTYNAGEGGHIEGETIQTVKIGNNGTTVTAVADEGYEFVGWSDGALSAERTDKEINGDLTLTALFEKSDTISFAGGSGTKRNPYRVSTEEQLKNVALYPDAHYLLINNIVLTAIEAGNSNFVPLFSDEVMFEGTFDGGGHTIKNLTVYNEISYYTGLFACVGKTGVVCNLTLENAYICGSNYIGGIAGYSLGSITGCRVVGKFEYLPLNEYKVFVGGIAGRADGDLNGCSSAVSVKADGVSGVAYIGGIAGYTSYNMRYKESITVTSDSTMEITASSTLYVGGVIGYASESLNLSDSFANGDKTVTSDGSVYVGGLAGDFGTGNTLTSCYATGDMTVTSKFYVYVGGLAGWFYSSSTFTSCYATGDMTVTSDGSVYAGGLVGCILYSDSTVMYSYSVSEIIIVSPDDGTRNGKLYLGGIVGYAGEVTLTGVHWLTFAENPVDYAVGYNDELGIPTNIGATKHVTIEEFYTLADSLNGGSEVPVWEHKTENSLPTLIF